jgi:predicted AAA+ superfamily ATPase
LQDAGALETIAPYLALIEEAYLVAALPKYSARAARQRSSPPKLVTLSNAFLVVTDPRRAPDAMREPERFGAWLENACLAHACNAGQRVMYWREEPLEVDGVLDGSWGAWAVEVKTGPIRLSDLRALLEFHSRYPRYRPLLIGGDWALGVAARAGVEAVTWRDYLLHGPPGALAPR